MEEAIKAKTQEELNREMYLNGIPETIWPFGYNAEEVVTVYGSLNLYHQHLAASGDLDQALRVISLLIKLKPHAVEASKKLKGVD